MSDTFTLDSSHMPPLPDDPAPSGIGMPDAFPQGSQRPNFGVPKFYVKQKRLKQEDGSVTFRNVEMVDIITPGDPKSTPTHKVTDRIKALYPNEYRAFREGIEAVPQGWPIDMWSYLNDQQVLHLKSLNILTVEQIAGLADAALHNIPMGRTLKNQAVAALRTKKEQDSVEAMRQKEEMSKQAIRSLEDSNMQLQSQLDEMQKQMAALMSAKADDDKPKRGRPPKDKADE